MLEKLNKLISKYTDKIPYEQIQISEYISSGASCEVYRANYLDNAIILKKFDSKHYDYEEGVIEDLVNEIDIYILLKGKNKLPQDQSSGDCMGYSFSNLNNSYQTYLIMKDYGTNGDFGDIIKNDKYWYPYEDKLKENEYYYEYRNKAWIYNMPRNYKLKLTISLCEALKELHDKNIVHCDLKPINMILVDDKIILIDFGVSRYLDKEKVIVTDEDMGTLGYMCEELQFGLCSKKSDIYSLGICILELWVGEIWQEGNTYKECRKETLNSLKYLECREKKLAKIIRNCILTTKKRPYIQTVIKNLRTIG